MFRTSQVRLWRHRRRVSLGPSEKLADTHRQVCAVSCNSMQVFLVSAEVLKMSPRLIQARVSIYTMWGFSWFMPPRVNSSRRHRRWAVREKNQVKLCCDTLTKLKLLKGRRLSNLLVWSGSILQAMLNLIPVFWGLASFSDEMSGWKQSPGLTCCPYNVTQVEPLVK